MDGESVLKLVSYFILFGIEAYILVQYAIGSWKFWEDSPKRSLYTGLVVGFWIVWGVAFLSIVPALNIITVGFVAAGLLIPPTVVLIALLVSPLARDTADRVSLRFAIEDIEGWTRIVVGILFIVWFFFDILPPIFAWVAGPGDILGGIFSYLAVLQLKPVAKYFNIERNHWSVNDVAQSFPDEMKQEDLAMLQKRVVTATVLVSLGIADFFAAPMSAGITFALGYPAIELAKRPLGAVPMLLVPQAFVLEVIAARQLHVLRKKLNGAKRINEVPTMAV